MSIDTDLQNLLADPKSFLENNALVIYGSNKGGSGSKRFVLQGTDDTGWVTSVGGGSRAVPMYVMYEEAQFNAKGSGSKSAAFDAHYVSMRELNTATGQWEDANVTHYTLPQDGCSVMVTSKLNGCTFGIGQNAAGARLVSHLRPSGGDAQARTSLDRGTRAGFAGGTLDVSVMSSASMNGTVLGMRAQNKWIFYAQRFQMLSGAKGMITDVQVYG